MKICWDNLENIKYDKKGDFWYKGNDKTNRYMERICICCKEEFLGVKEQRFCDRKCANTKEFNPQYNKSPSKETRQKLSIISKNRVYTKASIETREKQSISHKGQKPAIWAGGPYICYYNAYINQISFVEEVRRAPDDENILEVRCKYCGKWLKPTKNQMGNRIKSLNYNDGRYFYCSNECKNACPVYRKHKFQNGFTGDQNSSREVQPELRKLVLKRDDYTCQKCGLNSNEQCVILHCHHINPVILDPLESADIDNCITLCVDCHHEAHQKDGCSTGYLANCINI